MLSGGNRRPIPPYKPLPPATDSILNREKEQSDKNSNKHKIDSKPESSTEEVTTKKEDTDRNEATTHDGIENATKRYEENNGQKVRKTDSNTAEKPMNENSTKGPESEHPPKKEYASVMESEKGKTNFTKHDDSPKSVIPLEIATIKPTKTSKIGNSEGSSSSSNEKLDKSNISKTSTKSYSTLSIETSSSIQIIESTTTTKSTVVQSSVVGQSTTTNDDDVTSSTIGLQPSKSAEFESTGIVVSSIPTENLPSTFTKISPSVEKSAARIPATNTFSKNSGRKSARMHVKFFSFCKIILHSIHNEFLARSFGEQACSINHL